MTAMAASAQNQFVLDVTIKSRSKPRVTPVGLPVCEMVLVHQSEQTEAGSAVAIQLRIHAVAIGPIAADVAQLALATPLKVKGFLASRSPRNDAPVLHLTAIKIPESS